MKRESDWRKDVPFPWMESMFRPLNDDEVVVGDPDEKIVEMNATNWQLPEVFEKFSNPKTHRLRPVVVKIGELPRDVRCLLVVTGMMEDIARYTEEILFCPFLRQKGARVPMLTGGSREYPNIVGGLAPTANTDTTWRPGKRLMLINNGNLIGTNLCQRDPIEVSSFIVHEGDHRKIVDLVMRKKLHESHLSDRRHFELSAYAAQAKFLTRIENKMRQRGSAELHIENMQRVTQGTRRQIAAIHTLLETKSPL